MRKMLLSFILLMSFTSTIYAQSPCFSTASTFGTLRPNISTLSANTSPLPDDRLLLTHKVTTTPGLCNGLVFLGVPNFTTNTVNWGNSVTANSTTCGENIVLALSNTQGIIVYKEDIAFENNGKIKVINYASSGNTISSIGPEVEFTSPDPTNNGARFFSVARISNTKFLLTYTDFLFTGTPVTAQIGTVSGNNITFSEKVHATDPCCDAYDVEFSDLQKLDTDLYVITYSRIAETHTRYARIIDTSGADPVFGTSNALTGARSKNAKLAVLDNTTFILTFKQDNVSPSPDLIASQVCTVDVENITCGSPQIIYIGSTNPTSAVRLDSDTALIGIGNVTNVGFNVFAKLTNSNGSIVVDSLGLGDLSYFNIDSEVMSNTRVIITGYDDTTPTYFSNQFTIPCNLAPPLPESQGSCPCSFGFQCIDAVCYTKKVRYLSIAPNPMNAGVQLAIRIKHTGTGRVFWAGDPGSTIYSALSDTPVYLDWSLENDPIHIYGCGIVPRAGYEIQTIAQGSSTSDETLYSSVLNLSTAKWGDPVSVLFTTPSMKWGDPNSVVNATDINSLVISFNTPGAPNALPINRSDMDANQILNVSDIQRVVQAQAGSPYPGLSVDQCP
jgi:hypothetical protein